VVTTALPKCPKCQQSATGIYNAQLGCHRCGALSFDTRRPSIRIANVLVPLPLTPRSGLFATAANPTTVSV
jgi:hypothetical protein